MNATPVVSSKLVAKHNISEERYNRYENCPAIPEGVKHNQFKRA